MPLLTKMTARCDYTACKAETEVEVQLRLGPNHQSYMEPMIVRRVQLKVLSPGWTQGYLGDLYCPEHPGGQARGEQSAIDAEMAALKVLCPQCSALPGEPCVRDGQVSGVAHRRRREKAGG